MISVDTNILFAAAEPGHAMHASALAFVISRSSSDDVGVSEFVLTELYGLLRNPRIAERPLSAGAAVGVCQAYRRHPRWRLLGFPLDGRGLHDELWKLAGRRDLARRRIYDLRLALTLRYQGVTELATMNVKDFAGLGFEKVWNPLAKR